jgi:hypothetical protein
MNLLKKTLTLMSCVALIGVSATSAVLAQDDEDIIVEDGVYDAAVDTLSDVTNLSAEAGDASVTLSWDSVDGATGYIVFKGTNPVGSGEQYNLPEEELGDVTTYEVTGLTNGTTYYFSVAAMNDQALSESYGQEVSATPDGESAPAETEILAAEALDSTTVRVLFTTDMTLDDVANSVTIAKEFDDAPLAVGSVSVVDARTLDIVTEEQEPGVSYLITYTGDEVLTRSFLGSSNVATSDEFMIESAVSVSETEIEVKFSEEIVLGDNPINEIAIVQTEDNTKFLNITNVLQDNQNPANILIVTDTHDAVAYTMIVTEVTNSLGQSLSDENSTFEFGGFGFDGGDTTPPEEVSSLRAQLSDLAQAAVAVTWGASPNTAQDLANYLVYFSEDRGETYRLLSTLDPETLTFEESGLPEAEVYTFKVTARDQVGNESEGKTVSLPGTGPAGMLALALTSLAGGRLATRRRK